MRLVENETRLTMNKRRNFVNYADMTLSDGTVLHLTPSDFRISGQSFTDDWVDGEAFQIGTAIGKTATLLLDNTDGRTEEIEGEIVTYPHGKFSEYDFYMAYFVLYVCLPEAYHYEGELRDQMIRIGTFTVTTPTAHSSTIEITGVDNMYMFDKSFDDCGLDFTVSGGLSLRTILNRCCEDCGVAIGYGSFNNQNLTVSKKPEGVTYRQVVSYIAQIAGCNAKISDTGALILQWYDMSAFGSNWLDGGIFDEGTPKYVTGDDADGGSFNPWNTGYVIDGGDFATPLNYHNLISTNGTSISTDDIQFTGVLVQNEDTSAHYPDAEGWDNYAMVISDNPFVAGYEDTIALYIYSQLEDLKFRPFTTSSIQDPTIEAGDCALVYDVKGNMYKTIITNVTFKTGGMTELSCNAEPPTRQNSRYVNPAAQAVVKAEKKMNDYNAQVAHFNEIASQALGYYKTVEADTETGAIITYLHDSPTLETSIKVIKITADGMFISEDGGQSYNSGLDTSTATMLLNLIYVHGLTSDWIKTGELDVGGLNNEDGIIRVSNRMDIRTETIGEDSTEIYKWLNIGRGQINTSGSYRVFYTISNVESGKNEVIRCQIQKRDKWDGETYTFKVIVDNFYINDHYGELPIRFDIDTTDGNVYYSVLFSRVQTTNASFDVTISYNKINTLIDKNGIDTNNLKVTGGSINLNNKFMVDSDGSLTATSGKLAQYSIDQNGLIYNPGDYYAEYSTNKMHVGGLWNNSYWTYCAIANLGEFFHVDYGGSDVGGIWVTKNGSNNPYNFSGNTMKINADNISSSVNGTPQWTGSDRSIKQNIKNLSIEDAKLLVYSAAPREFEFKHNPGKKRYGFIAQELKKILNDNSGIEFEDDNGLCNINYSDFIAPLCMIVKEQQAEIDDLKKRIEALETLVNTNK